MVDPFDLKKGIDDETADNRRSPSPSTKNKRQRIDEYIGIICNIDNNEPNDSTINQSMPSTHDLEKNAAIHHQTNAHNSPIFRIDEPIVSPSATDISDDPFDNYNYKVDVFASNRHNCRVNSLGFANGVVYPPASVNLFEDDAMLLIDHAPPRLNSLGFANDDLDTKVTFSNIFRDEEEF